MSPRLLDLFCGAGGAAMGYHRAGFDVVGVDIAPQPRYPFEFHQGDAMTWPLDGFDAIHASPPCQAYSIATPTWAKDDHPRLIAPTRVRLVAAGVPYAIENVENARREMLRTVRLCGSMFGLPIDRHRYFEVGPEPLMFAPAMCNHERYPVLVGAGTTNAGKLGPIAPSGSTRRRSGRFEWSAEETAIGMGIDWMTRKEMDEAIPPAYTEWLGTQLLRAIQAVA